MPRLIVPSSGGGTKLIRTLLAVEGEGVCVGTGEGMSDSVGAIEPDGVSWIGDGVEVGDSCALAIEIKTIVSIATLCFVFMSTEMETRSLFDSHERISRDSATSLAMTSGLCVVAPVHVGENVVAPFAITEKFLVDPLRDKLIV